MREMKDSGIEWIGKIPRHWIYPKITYILDTEHEYPIGDGDHGTIKADNYVQEGIPFIRVQNLGFATPLRLDDVVYITKKQNITIKNSTLKPDDILFAKTGATIGKVGIVPKELLISNTTSHVGKITVNKKIIVPRFLFYALSSTVGYKLLWDIAGQKSTRPELSIEEIKRLHIILPDSLQEQQTIVDYLDAKCADIDSLTADIQKQINILKEYKKSVITQAVTKGLDPDVEMKDSGIEWIGMIPSKWNIGKIKSYVDKVGSGKTPKGDNTLYTKGKILFLRSQNVYNTGIILDDPPTVITDAIDKELSNTRVITDDVLLNITGGSIGRCCIYNLEKKANVNQHVSIIRMKKDKMLSGYMHYFWISDLGQTAINLYQTGGNREGMSASAIKNTPIPFMPIWEQQAIIDFLDSKCADIDAIISGKQKQLDVLKEYKKSLIYEYVTGKKEVPCRE